MKDLAFISKGLLFTQVHMRLTKEFGKLPTKGIVAGQAVATAIYDLVSLGQKGKYNDIDIFCQHGDMPSHIEKKEKRRTSLNKVKSSGKATSFYCNSYSTEMGSIRQSGYTIHSVAYDHTNPRFNYIGFHTNYVTSSEEDTTGDIIINAFDINCCQVAINLETKEVTWTSEFQDFLYSKELKSVYLGTPMHTAIRLLKKKTEMPSLTLDVKKEMKILQTSREFMMRIENMKSDPGYRFLPGNLFSRTYLERYKNHEDILNEYFYINKKILRLYASSEDLKPENLNEDTIVEKVQSSRSPDEEETMLLKTFWVANSNAYCQETVESMLETFNLNGDNHIDTAISHIRSLYNTYNKPSKKSRNIKRTVELIKKNIKPSDAKDFLMYEILGNRNTTLSGHSLESINKFVKFINKHKNILAICSQFSLDKVFALSKIGNWLEKNMMNHVIGQAESDSHYDINRWLKPDFKRLCKIEFEEKKNKLMENKSVPLFNNILPSINNEYTKVIEFTNEYELFEEGQRQRHCVGGYWRSIDLGDNSIFSIETTNEDTDKFNKGIRSTLCINLRRLTISQHYGAGNTQVNESHKLLGQLVLNKIIETRKEFYALEQLKEIMPSQNNYFNYLALSGYRNLLTTDSVSFKNKRKLAKRKDRILAISKGIRRKEHLKWLESNRNREGFIQNDGLFSDDIPF